MLIKKEINLKEFSAWSGGKETLSVLTSEEIDQVEFILKDLFTDGLTETQLNDILWFETDMIADWLSYESWEDLLESR